MGFCVQVVRAQEIGNDHCYRLALIWSELPPCVQQLDALGVFRRARYDLDAIQRRRALRLAHSDDGAARV